MRATLLAAIYFAAIALPAAGVEVLQTGRFTPDPPFPDAPNFSLFLGAPIAAGSGLVVVAEPGAGELYVFDAESGTRVEKITPSSANTAEQFGLDLAMEGSTAIVGASGVAYLYDIVSGTRIREFTPTTPVPSGASFGAQVAIGDGVVLVSATTDPFRSNSSGRVYAFDIATGQEIATFDPTEASSGFGQTLGVSNGVAVVSALWDDEAGNEAGAAYLFDVATGDQITKVLGPSSESYLGAGVAIDGDLAFIAEPLSSDALTRQIGIYDASTGDRLGDLQADNGAVDPSFGSFMSADSGRLLVGSILEEIIGYAYLFDTATSAQLARFTSIDPDSDTNFEFGHGVALSGHYAGALTGGGTTPAFSFVILPEPGAALLALLAIAGAVAQRRHCR